MSPEALQLESKKSGIICPILCIIAVIVIIIVAISIMVSFLKIACSKSKKQQRSHSATAVNYCPCYLCLDNKFGNRGMQRKCYSTIESPKRFKHPHIAKKPVKTAASEIRHCDLTRSVGFRTYRSCAAYNNETSSCSTEASSSDPQIQCLAPSALSQETGSDTDSEKLTDFCTIQNNDRVDEFIDENAKMNIEVLNCMNDYAMKKDSISQSGSESDSSKKINWKDESDEQLRLVENINKSNEVDLIKLRSVDSRNCSLQCPKDDHQISPASSVSQHFMEQNDCGQQNIRFGTTEETHRSDSKLQKVNSINLTQREKDLETLFADVAQAVRRWAKLIERLERIGLTSACISDTGTDSSTSNEPQLTTELTSDTSVSRYVEPVEGKEKPFTQVILSPRDAAVLHAHRRHRHKKPITTVGTKSTTSRWPTVTRTVSDQTTIVHSE